MFEIVKQELINPGNMQQLVGDPTITIQEIDAERLMELQTLPLDKAGNYNFQQGYAAI